MPPRCAPCVSKHHQALHVKAPYALDGRKSLEKGELNPLHSVKAGRFRYACHLRELWEVLMNNGQAFGLLVRGHARIYQW